MAFEERDKPLCLVEHAVPEPGPGELLVQVKACGVCRTDLHIVDGDLADPKPHIIPGHEIVGEIRVLGENVTGFRIGQRIGIPWLGHTCGKCDFCAADKENLCDDAQFTGYHINGGYADYAVADASYCFPIEGEYSDAEAAPLLCAGLIGYRSLKMAGRGQSLGIYGFGAAAHIVAQIAAYEGRQVYAFTRPGDTIAQEFARELGVAWSGGSDEPAPVQLDAAIIFAPVGQLVPCALKAIRKGGVVVCGGIHMSDIPAFPYEILWGERSVKSVANLTRADAREFLALAPKIPIRTEVHEFPLTEANDALDALRSGKLKGAAVLIP